MREWLEQELGVAPWVFEGVFLPLLAFLAVLLARELLLLFVRRRVEDPGRRKIWRRQTRRAAVPLAILAAVGTPWARQHSIARMLATGSGEVVEVQTNLGTATKIAAYTLILLTFFLLIQRTYADHVGLVHLIGKVVVLSGRLQQDC